MKAIVKHIGAVVLSVLLFFILLFQPSVTETVRAETKLSMQESYERTDVITDLQDATIGGKAFDLTDYPHNENGKPQMVSFAEFCYSYYEEKQEDYGFYVYIYNPRDDVFDTNTERNKIQLSAGISGSYQKYPLKFVRYSETAGYEGRFYKFKVDLTFAEQNAIWKSVEVNKREYRISGIELSVENVVEEYCCAQTYTYSGYALGYGSPLATDDSLTCTVDGFDDYITLDVNHTVYYKEGDFYHGQQSQLNSCFFRVPDKFFEEYGELTQIAYEWYEYVTNFILVTEDKAIYDSIDGLRGKGLGEANNGYDYLFCALCDFDSSWFKEKGTMLFLYDGWDMKDEYSWWEGISKVTIKMKDEGEEEEWLKNLSSTIAAAFYTNGTDCKDYSVVASDIMEKFQRNSKELGAPYYGGGYSQSLFCDFVDEGHKRGYNYREISPSDTFEVFWRETTKSLWQRIWGGYNVVTNYDSLPAIVKIKSSDLNGSDEDIANRLYIHKNDVKKLKSEYSIGRSAEEKETVILFRYGTSTALSMPCGQAASNASKDRDTELVKSAVKQAADEDFSAYITQQTVYLGFDIISLTFTRDNVSTVIPVVMSPMDVFSQTNPPDDITTRGNMLSWWQILLGVILLVVLVILLIKYAPWIIYWIGKLIALPFKGLAKLFSAGKERRRKRKEQRAAEKKVKQEAKEKEKQERRLQRKEQKAADKKSRKEKRKAEREQRRRDRKEAEKQRQEMEWADNEWEEQFLDEIDWDSIDWEDLDGTNW